MKAKLFFGTLFVIFTLAACSSEATPISVSTRLPSQTFTPVPPTPSPVPTIRWIMATPLNLSYSNSDVILSAIDELHPNLCNKENLLLLTPIPIESANRAPTLKFTEITALPEPNPNYRIERADNADKSRSAYYLGHEPGKSGNIFIRNNNGKIYEIYAEGATYDDWLQWINKDTFIAAHQGHVWINIVAINVEKQQFEYFGMASGCPFTATP